METIASVKRVNRFLIWLNVVTILTAVTIISSGRFVANAKPAAKTCTSSSTVKGATNTVKLTNAVFQGQMYNNNAHKAVANIKLTITTDPASHEVTSVDFQSTNVFVPTTNNGTFKGGGIPLQLASGSLDSGAQQNTLTNFTVLSTDTTTNQPVHIDFSGGGTSQALGGNYDIKEDRGQGYNSFGGQWSVKHTN